MMMTTHKALWVPADESKEVEFFDHRDGDMDEIANRVGTHETGMSQVADRITAAYDDVGLYTQPTNVNMRAMKIWAGAYGRPVTDLAQVLVGDYLFLGCDPITGDYADVPSDIADCLKEGGING